MTAPLSTVSLRRRVILYSLAVLAVVLLLVGALSLVFVGVQSRADLAAGLATRAAQADQLARQGTPPATIVERLAGPAVRVGLVGADGTVYGSRPGPDHGWPGEDRDGDGDRGPEGPRYRGGPPGHYGPVVRRTLADGSRLTLAGDVGELAAIQRRLSRLLLLLGIGGLAAAGLALLATTRVALRPLDTMTLLARSIAAGDRGRRLGPTRPNTELGRTAAAFDDMLDALEGAERQAREAESAARESELRTRQFVADAAHELRTPITGLRAAAEAALRTRATGEERDRLQLLLIREAGRAGRLVEDLLAMAQIDAGLRLVTEPVELRGLAEAEAERVRLLAPTLTVTVTGEPLTVPGDAGRLAQVLANLLDNARRHTPDGGTVDIEVVRASARAVVRVADSGPGVPAEDRERIFDRLVRLDGARGREPGSPGFGGAGLGLAIARGIARAHGGDLTCGADSVFELTLPAEP
ncbi:sensor histidine kinase [Pseudonocardia acaciae]|uniref:sensor histidine kinase n=1 Tax=Pseudonocardia acaciae TaxID=551276 RepID=UPI00049156F8|nr:HAMP domain-containing sensor histidine kinase [Pseudonocardia acaciae]